MLTKLFQFWSAFYFFTDHVRKDISIDESMNRWLAKHNRQQLLDIRNAHLDMFNRISDYIETELDIQ